jgi:uncharacterized membrane protein
MNSVEDKVWALIPKQHRRPARGAAVGAIVGATLGSVVAGPAGAVIGASLLSGLGAYITH